jgi:hypothetical protein
VDEEAGKLLLERAVVERDGKLVFSRDAILKDQVRPSRSSIRPVDNPILSGLGSMACKDKVQIRQRPLR